jgi:hypothetical protein
VEVSPAGVEMDSTLAVPVDVLFDDHPVWSFNPARDVVPRPRSPVGLAAWPKALRPFLRGTTRVVVRDHNSGESFFDRTVTFGDCTDPVRVVDAQGHPVTVDKGGHLQRTFSRTDAATRAQLMDAVVAVLDDLREVCGVDAFLVYGCLLGAVRDGHMIGHDSDADVSYYSHHTHPFDIALEHHRVVRKMRARGWYVVRMSAADFKIWVRLADGRRCGVDVFTAFHIGEDLHLMASLARPLPRSAVLPLSTVTLEGRELPAPADVEAFLAWTYGPGWRVPDPSFRFGHPRSTRRRMSGLWRGPRRHQRHWLELYRRVQEPGPPSDFVRWVEPQLEPGSAVLDCGAGDARDSFHLAGRGHTVTALDYAGSVAGLVAREAAACGHAVAFQQINFGELHQVLVHGARLAGTGRPYDIHARFLLDAVDREAREGFWRFARMVQRRGGRTFLEFRTPANSAAAPATSRRPYLDPEVAVREIEECGGTVLHRETGRGLAGTDDDPEVCRLTVRWRR